MTNGAAPKSSEVGLRLIIAYKLVKGSVQLVLAAVLLGAVELGTASEWLKDVVLFIRHHFASATSVKVAELLMSLATPRHLGLTALALALDGGLTLCEGVALRQRRWWGPWLVVVATGSLLPYEIVELVRFPRMGRLLLVVANALVVAYLARRALREHRARHAPE
jgi:uncharacterized membrane protein (DUF2068 family)